MEKLPKVLVIMSTYNGEKYLSEQIDSILAQKQVDVSLYVTDDCSKDRTQEIVKEYEKKHKNIKLHVNEKNKNFTYNFLDALFEFKDSSDYDYYAFSDQDDFWLEDKLISAVNKIKETGPCTLYASNLKVVDKDLNDTGFEMLDKKYKQGHYDILYGNVVTGCTIVFDNEFKNLATKYYPENIYLHDYWLAIIAHYTKGAHFIYDTCPDHILYRQHGSNLIGFGNKTGKLKAFIITMLRRVDKSKSGHHLFIRYWELYKEDIKDEDKIIIEKTANMTKFRNRIYLVSHVKTFHQRGYFFNIIFNKY